MKTVSGLRHQTRSKLTSVLVNPAIGSLHLTYDPSPAKTDHRRVAGCGSGRDATPATVLPPQDRINQFTPIDQPIGITDQPDSPSHFCDIGDAGPQPHVLPAHMRNVVDPPPRSRQVPIDEGHRPQPRTQIPIHRVLRGQVVMAHHLFVASQVGRGRQIVKPPDQLGDPRQALLTVDPGGLNRLPRHVTLDEAQHLTSLFIHPQEPRRSVPTSPLQQAKEPMNERRTHHRLPAHRVTDTDTDVHEPTRQRRLRHQAILPGRYRIFAITCPFHRLTTWQDMRREQPALFTKACHLEATINQRRHALGKDPVYLTRFNAPLADVTPIADTLPFDDGDGTCDSGWCFT